MTNTATATTATSAGYALMLGDVPLVVTERPEDVRDMMSATFKDWHARLLAGADVWLMVNGERVPNEHFLEWEGYNFAAEFAPRKRGYQVYANGSVHHSGRFWSVEEAVSTWYGRGSDHNRLKDRHMSDRTTIYSIGRSSMCG